MVLVILPMKCSSTMICKVVSCYLLYSYCIGYQKQPILDLILNMLVLNYLIFRFTGLNSELPGLPPGEVQWCDEKPPEDHNECGLVHHPPTLLRQLFDQCQPPFWPNQVSSPDQRRAPTVSLCCCTVPLAQHPRWCSFRVSHVQKVDWKFWFYPHTLPPLVVSGKSNNLLLDFRTKCFVL